MPIQNFQQLEAWQQAHSFVLAIYESSRKFPADERFGLLQQVRRAAVSVPANIAEGFRRHTSKDKAHFYNISESSLEELRYYIILSRDLEYLEKDEVAKLSAAAERVAQLLGGLMRSLCL